MESNMKTNTGDTSARSKVYECYLNGLSPDDAAEQLAISGIKDQYVKECYTIFFRAKEDNVQYKLGQIKRIEMRLFDLIEENMAYPKASTSNRINELQSAYCKFLVN